MFEDISFKEILSRILNRIGTYCNNIEGSYTSDIVSSVALEITKLYAYVDTLFSAMFPTAGSGEWLEKRCADYGITRKEGQCATADITVRSSLSEKRTLPAGTRLTASDTHAGFVTTETAELPAHTESFADEGVTVRVRAVTPGHMYIMSDTLGFDPQIPGLTVTNAFASSGADAETDEELYNRLRLRLSEPPATGTEADYRRWALEVPGVAYAAVRYASERVEVYLLGPEGAQVSMEKCEEVKKYIDERRPLGVSLHIGRPMETVMQVTATVELEDGYTIEGVKKAFGKALIKGYLDSDIFTSSARTDEISLATVTHILMQTPGVIDASKVKLGAGDSDVFKCSTVCIISPLLTLTKKGGDLSVVGL